MTIRYSSTGTPVWTNRYNGPADDRDQPKAIAVDAAGNVIVTGFSSNGTNDDDYTVKYAAATVIRNLSGCVNDVEAVYSMLMRNVAVKPERVTRLTNTQATRQAILDALSALAGHAEIKASTQVLIHYSGHGSQMSNRDGSEPDGLDETVVPHDARTEGPNGYVFDIPDKTLAALIDRIAQKTPTHHGRAGLLSLRLRHARAG